MAQFSSKTHKFAVPNAPLVAKAVISRKTPTNHPQTLCATIVGQKCPRHAFAATFSDQNA
jgi:hypothetical protein